MWRLEPQPCLQIRHICGKFPRLLGTGLFQAPFHMEFVSFGREILAQGDSFFLEAEGRDSIQGSALRHQAQACPGDTACRCCPSGSLAAPSLLRDVTATKPSPAKPLPALTFLAPSSMGARHSGVLLRTLLTKVETGWKTMFSVGWMSLTASWVGTSAKSSHFLMASSPSRMAGILGDKTVRAKAQD